MNDSATRAGALDRLLRGDYPDPDGGPPISVPVEVVRIERSLRDIEADLVAPLGLGRRLAVVSDPATRAAMGARLERALAPAGTILPVVLRAQPHADAETVAALRRACASADALVAVGSGTINDLCKFAAAKEGKPYVVFATAPSMNGYTSMNAAITVDGHKKTLPAVTPRAVFMDLEVLAAAPARMIRAGLGDSLCRPTAQVDWLLSHHLLGTPYRSAPFAMLEEDESVLLDSPEALLAGDLDAMRALARTLVLSGLGMTICGGSYPASQGEHLISHYIDMFAPAGRGHYFHGEQVAVATLTMARIQEAVLAGGPPRLQASPITAAVLKDRFGPEIGESCWREFEPKRVTRRNRCAAVATRGTGVDRSLWRRRSRQPSRDKARGGHEACGWADHAGATSALRPISMRRPSAMRGSCATGTLSSTSPMTPGLSPASGRPERLSPVARHKQRLTQHERHAQIAALLRHEGTVRIATLAKAFDVTTETVRRDLDELAETGALNRTYGGGASRSLIDEPGIGVRSRTHAAERGRIARAAARMVEPGDALMIDGGSTTRLFAQMLAARELHLTVVTNCLPVAQALGTNPHCRTILCPGDYVAHEGRRLRSRGSGFHPAVQGEQGVHRRGRSDFRRRDRRGLARLRDQARDDGTVGPDDPARRQLEVRRSFSSSGCARCRASTRWCREAAPPKRLAGSLKSAGVHVVLAPE